MTLALLLTAATGAWAEEVTVTWKSGDTYENQNSKDGVTLVSEGTIQWTGSEWKLPSYSRSGTFTVERGVITKIEITGGYIDGFSGTGWSGRTWTGKAAEVPFNGFLTSDYDERPWTITFTIDVPDVEVAWDAATNTGTFDMIASDVVLTPIYSEATLSRGVGTPDETETAYESLKEAIANVKDGDVITLDWNVTLTEDLKTPVTNSGVKFTLDFNGYTIDGGVDHNGFTLVNSGDEMTLTDNTYDQKGGLKGFPGGDGKYIFAGGRYNIPSYSSAANLNQDCSDPVTGLALAEGMEFVDLEGEAEANDGFTMRVTYAAFELTIGPKKFATFYDDHNVTLDEHTPNGVGLYTIKSVNGDRTMATVVAINSAVVPGTVPMLVYNGTDQEQAVKLKVTSDEPTSDQMWWSLHFQGTAVDREFTTDDMDAYNYFALSGGKAFAPVRGTGTLAAHKCWLQFAKENQQQAPGARSIMLVFEGEATGIDSMVNDQRSMDDYYDLNGRKIQKPTRKGVYIKNGQKVVK